MRALVFFLILFTFTIRLLSEAPEPGDGGPATAARVDQPSGVAVDTAGNLYVAESTGCRIRKIDRKGIISTIAGTGDRGFSGDGGPAIAATLNSPVAIAVDSLGNIFFSDEGNARIRKISPNGTISTFFGDGVIYHNSKPPYENVFPHGGILADGYGGIFVPFNECVYRVDASGNSLVVAGNGTAGFSGDGGPAINSQLYNPVSIAVDQAGDLFIADFGSRSVRKVDTSGRISTVAGNHIMRFSGDGGPATKAEIMAPTWVAVNSKGELYISDSLCHRVRKVDKNGIITTIAGNGYGIRIGKRGRATAAPINGSGQIAIDKNGDLFIADPGRNEILKVDEFGGIKKVAGDGSTTYRPPPRSPLD
jgi:trimeric autotransporter adhesin